MQQRVVKTAKFTTEIVKDRNSIPFKNTNLQNQNNNSCYKNYGVRENISLHLPRYIVNYVKFNVHVPLQTISSLPQVF